MKIIDAGHAYLLEGYDDGYPQRLVFLKREGDKFPFNRDSYGGTNCQEVLRALIDRSKYLNSQSPCAETEAIIGNLESALLLFEVRAARKHDRHIDHQSVKTLMFGQCDMCGHIDCNCKEK